MIIKKFFKVIDKFLLFNSLYKIYRKFLNLKLTKVYNTKSGKYLLPVFAVKDIIRNEIIRNNIFNEDVYNRAKKYIKKDSVVLDAGANYGQMSILFSQIKDDVKVYSFESSKYIFDILKKNINLNNANCIPINCILGNETGEFHNIKKAKLDNFNTYGSNKIEIIDEKNVSKKDFDRVKTLIIDEFNFDKKISLFKIDVQGYDLEVLKGSKKTISSHKMPIIFEYEKLFEKEFNYSFKDFENFINEINYNIVDEFNNNYLILPK